MWNFGACELLLRDKYANFGAHQAPNRTVVSVLAGSPTDVLPHHPHHISPLRNSGERRRSQKATMPGAFLCCLSLWLLIAASTSRWASAQTPAQGGQQIIHEFWSFRDGAPQVVESLAQTTDGYLWLGTESGLYRFDGVRFERFQSPFGEQLPATDIACLFAPRTGGLWIGYRIGDPFSFLKSGKLTNFKFSTTTGTVQGFAEDRRGIVWAGSTHGVWRFDGSKWQQNPYEWNPQLRVAQLGFDRDGILWVLTDRKSTEVGRQLFYLLPDGTEFRKAASNVFVEGFTRDADATVLTTHEKGPLESGSGLELEDSLPGYPILRKNSEQTVDRANGIWFVSSYDPLFRHPAGAPLTEVIRNASRSNSQEFDFDPYRYSRLVDREGGIWIGSVKGIHRFSYSPLMQLQLPESHGWFALAPDDGGAVWISTGTGTGESTLYHVVDGKVVFQKQQRGEANFAYRAPDKTFWFAGEGGLWHMVGDRLTKIELPPSLANPDNAQFLQAITQDRSGGMWVAFWNRGIYRFADGVWAENGGRRDLPRQRVYIEFRDHLDRIWFGSRNNLLAVLDGDRVQTFGPSDGVRVGEVTAIYGRGSEIWIGGEFGLQQFDHGRFHSIQALDEDSLRGISGIVETVNGDLWLNGLGGISHIPRQEIAQALKNSAYQVSGERFGRSDGLPGLAPSLRPIPSAIEGTDGRLWFTVNNGVVSLDPAHASKRVAPPPVSIQSISADDRSYRLDSPIVLPPLTSSVQIGYAAISLSGPETIRFRYKLQEIDSDWHDARAPNFVSYRNLAPGSYHFVVSVSDTNGLWSDNTAAAEFTIRPAFYQTNWFRALCAAALLALLWMLYRLRMRQLAHEFDVTLEARVEERTRIARELHDTLLQSFNGLQLRFRTVHALFSKNPNQARTILEEALDDTRQALTEGRKAVQGLRPSPIEAHEMSEAIKTLIEELASDPSHTGGAEVRLNVEGTPRKKRPLIQDEIYRITSEALRNAFHHAEASRIEVQLSYGEKSFEVRVRDDGKGIDHKFLTDEGPAGHFGLRGMRERAQKIGGQLTVWSAPGSGTELALSVPAVRAYAAPSAPWRSWITGKFSGSKGRSGNEQPAQSDSDSVD